MVIAAVIAGFGWQMGYLSTAALGAAGVVLLVLFMHDSPQSSGSRPSTSSAMNRRRRSKPAARCLKPAAGAAQPGAVDPRPRLRLYVHRPHAVNSWGSSFWSRIKLIPPRGVRDYRRQRYRRHRRDHHRRHALRPLFPAQPQRDGRIHQPAEHRRLRPDALVAAITTDILAMIIFGATIGALTCFLGGLIAVDISSRKAAGAALGTIGIASYAGAGRASFSPGSLLIKRLSLRTAKRCMISAHWRCSVGTGLGSALLCFTTAAIVARRHAVERQTSFSS